MFSEIILFYIIFNDTRKTKKNHYNYGGIALNFQQYIRTDIASERSLRQGEITKSEQAEQNGFNIHRVTLEKDGDDFRAGSYCTVDIGEVWNFGKSRISDAASAVGTEFLHICESFLKNNAPVLTVCLGNRRITSDALGPLCADRLIVTRHIKTEAPKLFKALGNRECSVFCPGVTGDTGIETFELIRSAAYEVKPSLVICIDALASKSIDRLVSTIQISSAGLSPGSGIGNNRKEISINTLGIPVVGIGVPTVVHSSSLIAEALEKAGMTDIPDPLQCILENGKSYFVTVKETDSAVKAASDVIAQALNTVLLGISEL